MAKTAEALTVEQGSRNGTELLDALRAGVVTVESLNEATMFARKHRNNADFARGLNAFLGFTLSGSLSRLSEPHGWRQASSGTVHVNPREVTATLEDLTSGGERLRTGITDNAWVNDYERAWEGRKVTIWQPSEANTDAGSMTTSAPLSMAYDHARQNTSVSTGVVLSGEIYAIDLGDKGSVGLRDGTYRYFDYSYGGFDKVPAINPVPMTEYSFDDATVGHIFERRENPLDGSDIWLSRIAIREVEDFSASVHPEHVA